MTLTKFNPETALQPSTWGSLFDRFFDDSPAVYNNQVHQFGALDVYETDQAFELEISLPGMTRQDIKVEVENQELRISGERSYKQEDNRKHHRLESYVGKFVRRLRLPKNVDAKGINAKMENGVLYVSLPKTEEAQSQLIEIQ